VDESGIRYATTTGGLEIAYTVVGDGPVDIVFVPGLASVCIRRQNEGGYSRTPVGREMPAASRAP
jgi:hypothetical protein